jgi:hypothetical protein
MIDSSMTIERTEKRKEIVRPVYFLDDKDSSQYAFSTNLSKCGLCLITNRQISEGETLDIFSKFFWDDSRKAIAVWTKDVSDSVLKVGMILCPDA